MILKRNRRKVRLRGRSNRVASKHTNWEGLPNKLLSKAGFAHGYNEDGNEGAAEAEINNEDGKL